MPIAMRLPLAAAGMLVLCVSTRSAGAQTCNLNPCTDPVTASATINSVARLSITSTTTALTSPKGVDFGTSAGVNNSGPTLTVKSNAGYTLTAAAATSTWTGGSNNKPATDLKMTVNGGSVTALGQVAHSTTATAGTSYTIGYNTIYSFTVDKPGTYSLVVNYTLTAP